MYEEKKIIEKYIQFMKKIYTYILWNIFTYLPIKFIHKEIVGEVLKKSLRNL